MTQAQCGQGTQSGKEVRGSGWAKGEAHDNTEYLRAASQAVLPQQHWQLPRHGHTNLIGAQKGQGHADYSLRFYLLVFRAYASGKGAINLLTLTRSQML